MYIHGNRKPGTKRGPQLPNPSPTGSTTHRLKFSGRKHRFRSSPAHSWTPTMPKMKKTKKQRSRTLPSIGKVSSSNVTRMRMPVGAEEACWGLQCASGTGWQSSPRGSIRDDVKVPFKLEGRLADTPNSPRQSLKPYINC